MFSERGLTSDVDDLVFVAILDVRVHVWLQTEDVPELQADLIGLYPHGHWLGLRNVFKTKSVTVSTQEKLWLENRNLKMMVLLENI